MKVLILAGGLGSRLSEETTLRPKPMVEIGGKPILWHILKSYSHFGFNEFIILCGYKGYMIKEYFANYYQHMSDIPYWMKNIAFTDKGWGDFMGWSKTDRKIFTKISNLIEETAGTPFKGSGNQNY